MKTALIGFFGNMFRHVGSRRLGAALLALAVTTMTLVVSRASQAQESSAPPAEQSSSLVIKAVGDMVPGTNFPDKGRLPAGGARALLERVEPLFGGADILFGNFESTFTDYPKTRKDTNRKMVFAFRSPPEYASDFKRAGFDVLSIANNHSNDFFQKGFDDTAAAIEAAGMAQTGIKGEITYLERKGKKIAFIGFSYLPYHNSVHQIKESAALVEEANRHADIVVISVHAGAEGNKALHVYNQDEKFYSENRGNLVRFNHTMIDHGADLVLGHGPHVPRAMELYRGRLIAYSLGNFMGYKVFSIGGYTGYSLVLEARLAPDGKFLDGKILPVMLSSTGAPAPDEKGSSIGLIRELSKKDFPGSPLVFDSAGRISVSP